MSRLGYTHYVAQGGDVGAGVCDAIAIQAPDGLAGIHLNFLRRSPLEVVAALLGQVRVPHYATRSLRPRSETGGLGTDSYQQRHRRTCPLPTNLSYCQRA
jgi:hypothetical protein